LASFTSFVFTAPPAPPGGRTVLVGDVHGCRRELDSLLDAVDFGVGDRLVLVGDVLARGPDSLGVLDLLRCTGALFVRGNHEAKVLSCRDGDEVAGEHLDLAKSLRPVDWVLLECAPLVIDLPEHGLRVVHAGLDPRKPIEQQSPRTVVRMRTIDVSGRPQASRTAGRLWGRSYAGPPHVVFGHNAVDGLQLHRWATGLDTGCVYGGRLTALVLPAKRHPPRAPGARRALLVSVAARRPWFKASSGSSRVRAMKGE